MYAASKPTFYQQVAETRNTQSIMKKMFTHLMVKNPLIVQVTLLNFFIEVVAFSEEIFYNFRPRKWYQIFSRLVFLFNLAL